MIQSKSLRLILLLFSFFFATANAQTVFPPLQRTAGDGGSDYSHADVVVTDLGSEEDGFWLFEPGLPTPDSAQVVIFLHGYGCYNPMIYGRWIKHLVRKGNIVIYPRYQLSVTQPRTTEFTPNTVTALQMAYSLLGKEGHVSPTGNGPVIVGHSYGGVIGANIAVQFETFGLPKPKALLAIAPGTSYLRGGLIDSYASLPDELKLAVVVCEDDRITGDSFGNRLFSEAAVEDRILLRQHEDNYGYPNISAGHNEAYSVDLRFDTGVRNYSARKALRIGRTTPVDYNLYWKLLDGMITWVQSGNENFDFFQTTDWNNFLGKWTDGTPIQALEAQVPVTGKGGITHSN